MFFLSFLSAATAASVAPQSIWKRLDFSLTGENSCTSSPQSCVSSSSDYCCVEEQGLILQTQFWDYDVAGPTTSWTIHGLWPDKCDGSYESNCGYSDTVSSVKSILSDAGETDLLDYMSEYWLNDGGSSETLWTHEFNKHGTCMSTLATSCLGSDATITDTVVDFAKLTVEHFQQLPTYKWLSAAGITPSEDTTYDADDISAALKSAFGYDVYIGCKSGVLNEVWYFHQVSGSLLNNDLVPIDAVTSSTCSGSVQYLPKTS